MFPIELKALLPGSRPKGVSVERALHPYGMHALQSNASKTAADEYTVFRLPLCHAEGEGSLSLCSASSASMASGDSAITRGL